LIEENLKPCIGWGVGGTRKSSLNREAVHGKGRHVLRPRGTREVEYSETINL
jgi:hypothetical protein